MVCIKKVAFPDIYSVDCIWKRVTYNQATTTEPFGVVSCPFFGAFPHKSEWLNLIKLFILACLSNQFALEGADRSLVFFCISAVAAHHGPTPAFQTIMLDRACLTSILKGSQHSGGGHKACSQGFQKCTRLPSKQVHAQKSFRGELLPPLVFSLLGMVWP
jgi:hypothetical protein